jgi:Uncharacterized protein conserved in bacteria
MPKITPHLWFDTQAEEAVNFYTSIFKNSRITGITRYGKAGAEVSQMPEGSVMTLSFELDGQKFMALNGGPIFKFNESISFMVYCKNQKEIDYFWDKLSEGGDEKAQQCGWLKGPVRIVMAGRTLCAGGDDAGQRSQESGKGDEGVTSHEEA